MSHDGRLRAVSPRAASRRPGRIRTLWSAVRRRPGWLGLGLGVLAGAAVTALVFVLVPVVFGPAGDLEPGGLTVLSGIDPSGQRQALLDQWNRLHPANRATLVPLSSDTDQAHASMLQAAQRHDPVDVFNLDVISVAEFADAGYLRPVDADTDGFLAQPLDTCRYKARLWCLPFNSDAGLLYYRTDLVRSPPTTLTGITDDTESVLGTGRVDSRVAAGYTGQLRSDYEGFTVNALEAIWAAGGDVVDDHGNVVIDSPQTQAGLHWLATGLRGTNPSVILPSSDTFQEAQSVTAFEQHKVVFLRMWPNAYLDLQKPAADGGAPVPFAVTNLPGPSALGGQDLAIGAQSRHPRAAQALIGFLTSERSQQLLFERGAFAATREVVYYDDVINQKYPYAGALLAAIRSARVRPVTAHYARFSAAFRDVVTFALGHDGQLPPGATQRLSQALRGY